MKMMYILWQWTWGILQTLLGFLVFLWHIKNKHYSYYGAIVTEWESKSSVSLGCFVFVTKGPYFADKLPDIPVNESLSRLLVHEYGHTIQSLILGPLYLIAMGIPSTLWGFLPSAAKKRKTKKLCPMDVDMTDNARNRANGTECILCMECVKNCPKNAL